MTTPVRDALPDGVPSLTGDVLAIRGGRPLRGRVDVKGAKNLATKAMVATLLG
jgi:UDP-N-acetylglucosamine 1-carboxyvinyltransferase